jgi:hypothetical protein
MEIDSDICSIEIALTEKKTFFYTFLIKKGLLINLNSIQFPQKERNISIAYIKYA